MVGPVSELRNGSTGNTTGRLNVPMSDGTPHASSKNHLKYPRPVAVVGLIVFALIEAGCTPSAVATSSPTAIGEAPTNIPAAVTSTVESPAQVDVTATPKIEVSIPSPFEGGGLYYGSYGVDAGGKEVITGAIKASDFQSNNPNSEYKVPSIGNGEVQVNTLYSQTNSDTPAATTLDGNWLDAYFHASTGKDSVTTGVLPDGTPVTKQGVMWVDASGNVLNPIVRNIAGQNFGWPMIAEKGNKLYMAVVDGDGKLVGNEQFQPAFQKPADLAREVGFAQADNVTKVELTGAGTLQMFDAQGKWLGEAQYVGNGKTFEQQVASAEYATPTMYAEVVGQYAKAYGLEVNNIQLHAETSIINGKPVAFQVDQNGIPLFILDSHDGESKWEYFNLPASGNLAHIRWGSTTNEGEAFTDSTYINLLQNEFQIISPIDPTILDINTVLKDPYYGPFVENLAKTHDFRLYNLFWHADHRQAGSSEPNLTDPIWEGAPGIGQQASPEYQTKIRNYMAEKARLVLHDNPSMTELGFANEAFSADDSGWFGWEDSPYYRAFGDRWLIEAYVATYNAVLQSGKVPGKDIKLFYGDYNFELPGNKSNHVYDEMQRLRTEAAKQLNLNPSDLPLVIDMQMHINFEPNVPPGEFSGNKLTEEKLLQNLAKFANVGEVFIGEMTMKGGTPEQKQEALLTVIRAAVKSKNVDSIVFWDLLRNGGYWEGGKLLFNVDDNSYSRTKSYFELLKTIKTLVESGD